VIETAEMSPARRLGITIAVMTATMMQVLDTTIANVAMPHMQAQLSATLEQVAWVLTSYILASAVATPLTGWIEDRIGRRALFTLCAGGFTVASALCGAAPTLSFMVAARVAQGLFGALLMPLSQAVVVDIYPPEKRAQAIGVWSMTTMIGPILGPILGGWLTDALNWRWVFYVNVPFGILCTAALWLFLPAGKARTRSFDMAGFAMLATAIAALQLLLDRGTQKDWFDSTEILIEAGLAIAAAWMFVIHTMTAKAPLIPRALFADRNFMISAGLTLIVFGVSYSSQALMAPMLQQLMHYDTSQAGTLMAPRGIGVLVAIIIASRVINSIDSRAIMAAGLVCLIGAQFMMSGFDIVMGRGPIVVAGFIQGLGNGLVIMPLTMTVFITLPAKLTTDAAAMIGLIRNLAGSIAIAIGGAFAAHSVQVAHAELGEHVTRQTMPMLDPPMVDVLGRTGGMAAAMVDAEVNRQALMIAYINDFWLMMWVSVIMLPLLFLFRPGKGLGANRPPPVME
jgi:DHA2 family multidrug resistance protein